MRTSTLKRRFGGAVLELVLVLPLLIMLSFGVVDYGYYFYVKNSQQGAAQAAARAAIMGSGTNTRATAVVTNLMTAAGLSNSGYQLTFSPSDVSTAAPGTTVTVTITSTWGQAGTNSLPTWLGGISSSKQIRGVAAMIKESSGG